MPDLSRLGLGTAPIGNLYRAMSDAQAEATVIAALDAGIRNFDTAPHYGFGLAEERLGRALAGRRDVSVSTKVGRLLERTDDQTPERHGFVGAHPYEPVFDYSADAVLRSHASSLARLGLDRVGCLLAHDLGRLTHGDAHDAMLRMFLDGGYPAMRRLRDEGAIDAIGIGVNEVAVCLDLLARVDLDVILLAGRYTLLDRSAADVLLPLCATRGVRVMVGGPYNSGILSRSKVASAEGRFNYEPARADIVAKACAIEARCDRFGVALPEAALQFPLRHPAVDRVIAGMASPAEVADNVARLAAPIPEPLWEMLETVSA